VKKIRLLQLFVAVLLALVVGVINYHWLTGAVAMPAPEEALETRPVVVAARDLEPGAKLTAEALGLREYLLESIPATAYGAPEEVVGRVLAVKVASGEPVLETRLAPPEITVGGIQGRITQGKRAMAVRGNEVLGISGFVHPGDRVDVLVTLNKDPDGRDPATKLVLESLPVLATGTVLEPKGDGTGTSPVDVYTLEVSPEEAEVLALVATQGTLYFAMRNLEDTKTVLTAGADIKKTLAQLATPSAARPARKATQPKTVDVIKGGERQRQSF
jgi:pilus assembly protein CpaB